MYARQQAKIYQRLVLFTECNVMMYPTRFTHRAVKSNKKKLLKNSWIVYPKKTNDN